MSSNDRKSYSSPSLTVCGSVEELTLNLNGGGTDGLGGSRPST